MIPAWTDDSTVPLLRHGYRFISRRCDRDGADVVETRLAGVPVTLLRGPEAAAVFYDTTRFRRRGAMPLRVRKTLLGVGGVQGLDGAAHHRRKELFMALMGPAGVDRLVDAVEEEWTDRARRWAGAPQVTLFDEVGPVLCAAAHAWTGVPLAVTQLAGRTAALRAMIDAPAGVGARYRRGVTARRAAETGLARTVERVRRETSVSDPSPLTAVATHRDHRRELLPSRVAAVELINLLRPIVAIDRFVTFAALALHEHPEWRDRIAADPDEALPFVHEVRRYFPFFPATAARVVAPFDWAGHHFPAGRRVLLDLYGTDHHPDVWPDPDRFDPERFRERIPTPFDLIPQGGGSHADGHRCAGEWITIAVMTRAVQLLARMTYRVPPQDLTVSTRRIPTLPASGFVIADVRMA